MVTITVSKVLRLGVSGLPGFNQVNFRAADPLSPCD
jgi:hypothetical protein